MKYIKFKNMGLVCFQVHISHAEMARRIKDTPVSAGFAYADESFNDGKPFCSGKSASLKIKSEEDEDSFILSRALSH